MTSFDVGLTYWVTLRTMVQTDQALETEFKEKIERSLKEFFPAAATFTGIFLFFRVYEFILLRGRIGARADLAKLEFGSLGYDLILASALVATTLILHIAISFIWPRVASRITTIVFIVILLLNFFAVQYFASTLEVLNVASIGSQFSNISNNVPSGLNWITITPLLVLIPIAIAGFSEMKDYLVVHHLSVAHIVAVVVVCNMSWFLPMSPPQLKYRDEMDYHLATNKTYLLISDAWQRFAMQGERIVSRKL